MKRRKGITIAVKFALVITVVLMICSASIGVLAYLSASNESMEALRQRLQNKVTDSAAQIKLQIHEYFTSLEGIALRPDIVGMDWDTQKPVLEKEAARLGFMKMGVSNLDGEAVYSNGSSTNISKRQYFQLAVAGSTNISDPLMSTAENKMVLVIATPIKDSTGKITGVLLATSDDRFLSNLVGSVKEGSTGYAFMLNKSGTVIAHPQQQLVLEANNNADKLKENGDLASLVTVEKKMIAGEDGFDTFVSKGVPYFSSFTGIEGLGWSMAVAVTQQEVLEPMVRLRASIVMATLISLLAGVFAAILFARMLVIKPIQAITAAARKLALGDIDVTFQTRSGDEIGQMSEAFESIIRGIRQQSEAAEKIANGEMDADVTVRSDKDVLNNSLESMIRTQRQLSSQFETLIQASSAGDFSQRGEAGMLSGQYARMLSGVNSILDEVEGALAKIKSAQLVAQKQASYQQAEVGKLVRNLERLAEGSLDCDMQAAQPDADTQELYEVYDGISHNLHQSVNAIRGYISDITHTLGMMSQGNLDVQITGQYKGDFVRIKESINEIILSLNDTLHEINTSAEQVAAGTQQVAAGSQALSQGATEQASAIEQLTASLMEIAAQTRQNALSAAEASALAQTAKQDAVEGDDRMDQLQRAMGEINESSTSISRIIKVIDEIAFQTNLLALNAAVEAARAGQHGKGFAVVAEEVRNLAQRSANAAKETTAMIEGSIRKVKEGTRIANDTAQALNRIVGGVQKASVLVGGIAEASGSQAQAVAQVNTGIDQVSMVTQTNSATAEESAAASEELSSQAVILKDMVGRFTLRGQAPISGQRGTVLQAGDGKHKSSVTSNLTKPRISLADTEFGKY